MSNITKKNMLLGTIDDIYTRAKHFKLTSEEIQQRYIEQVLQAKAYQKLPIYMKEFIRGYRECLYKQLWHDMIFSYEVDGKRLTLDSEEYRAYSPEYVNRTASHTGAFVWKTDHTKFFTKPTGEYEGYNAV